MRHHVRVVECYGIEGFIVEFSPDNLRWQELDRFPSKEEAIFYAKMLDLKFSEVNPLKSYKEIHWLSTHRKH